MLQEIMKKKEKRRRGNEKKKQRKCYPLKFIRLSALLRNVIKVLYLEIHFTSV